MFLTILHDFRSFLNFKKIDFVFVFLTKQFKNSLLSQILFSQYSHQMQQKVFKKMSCKYGILSGPSLKTRI